jgi:hypothetical protein
VCSHRLSKTLYLLPIHEELEVEGPVRRQSFFCLCDEGIPLVRGSVLPVTTAVGDPTTTTTTTTTTTAAAAAAATAACSWRRVANPIRLSRAGEHVIKVRLAVLAEGVLALTRFDAINIVIFDKSGDEGLLSLLRQRLA